MMGTGGDRRGESSIGKLSGSAGLGVEISARDRGMEM